MHWNSAFNYAFLAIIYELLKTAPKHPSLTIGSNTKAALCMVANRKSLQYYATALDKEDFGAEFRFLFRTICSGNAKIRLESLHILQELISDFEFRPNDMASVEESRSFEEYVMWRLCESRMIRTLLLLFYFQHEYDFVPEVRSAALSILEVISLFLLSNMNWSAAQLTELSDCLCLLKLVEWENQPVNAASMRALNGFILRLEVSAYHSLQQSPN